MISEIVEEIKKKKELRSLSKEFVRDRIIDYCKEAKVNLEGDFRKFNRTREYKKLFKTVRKICWDVYGVFKKEEHLSKKERDVYYKEIYSALFSITGKPKKILDLGCGLNPLSYIYLDCKPEYYAADIGEDEVEKVKDYFKKNEVRGDAFVFDLLKIEDYYKLPKVDVCFLFKVLEGLEEVKLNISEEVIKRIKANWIIASFSTKSISGKKAIKKRGRLWLIRILKRNNYWFNIVNIGEEIFFVVKKGL